MSDLNRLRELAALLLPKPAQVQEAATEVAAIKSFDTISRIIDDALDELQHKLGKNGMLERLMDNHGVRALDKHKDSDGMTMLGRLATRTEQYSDEVNKAMEEIEILLASAKDEEPVKEELAEMAKPADFRSGYMKTAQAKEMVKAFRAGEETFDLANGDKYTADKALNVKALEAGQIVFASYSSTNQGAELVQVLGFNDGTGDDDTAQYASVKELLEKSKASSLAGLADARMVVKDLEDGSSGGWYYQHGGRFCRGSGAEKLTFTLVKKS